MYVGRVMHTDLVTIAPKTTLIEARDILEKKQIKHLLVVDKKNELIGIVSDRDLKKSWASSATALSTHELNYLLNTVTVDSIMVKKTITITPDTTIERAASTFQENRISSLPVVDGDKLLGIITSTDVMGVLLEAIGIDRDSTRFSVLVGDRIGVLADVSKILKEQNINVRSLFSWPEKNYPGFYSLVIRVSAADGEKAISVLKQGGFNVLTKYVQDLTPYLPET